MARKYDLIIIGAGPAGYEAAIYAGKKGINTALIEKNKIGGTCLNNGCIPTKVFLHAAHLYSSFKTSSYFGITVENVDFSWGKIIARKDRLLKRMQKAIENDLNNVELISGEAILKNKKIVEINGEEITADNILLASGTKPLEINNLKVDNKFIFDTNQIMNLKKLPKSICIVGGGVIGIEFADIFSSFGIKVAIVELLPDILVNQDLEAKELVKKSLEQKGVEFHLESSIKDVSNRKISLTNSTSFETEALLVTIGRQPNTKCFSTLDLDKKGFVLVNEYFETSQTGVYAVGDVIGRNMFAHTATYQAIKVIDKIFSNTWNYQEYVPAVVFTSPQIASIGAITGECITIPLSKISRYQIDNQTTGFMKVFFREDRRITGMAIVADNAESIIGQGVILVNKHIQIDELKDFIFPHPSHSEFLGEIIKSVIS